MAMIAAACTPAPQETEPQAVKVQSVSIKPDHLDLIVGGTSTVELVIEPKGAQASKIVWSVDDESIAKWQEDYIIGVGDGETTLRVDVDGAKASAKIHVESQFQPGPQEGVFELNLSEYTLEVDETLQLFAQTGDPEDNPKVSWRSSDEEVASVDQNGKVTALSEGDCVITASADDGRSASCTIHVKAKTIYIESLTVSPTEVTMNPGGTVTLSAEILPENTTDKTLTWESSDTAVATVEGGVVTAVSVGTATVKVTCGTLSASCAVTVSEPQGGLEKVDMGLPSGKLWASQNLGAKDKYDSGLFYAWGELTPKGRSIRSYLWADGGKMDKYTHTRGEDLHFITTDDGLSCLLEEDDVAHYYLGEKWRIPTSAEIQELIDNTTIKWIYRMESGKWIYGFELTSKTNGNTMFFPEDAPYYNNPSYSEPIQTNSMSLMAYFWSNEISHEIPYNVHSANAMAMTNSDGYIYVQVEKMSRDYYIPIRPIYADRTQPEKVEFGQDIIDLQLESVMEEARYGYTYEQYLDSPVCRNIESIYPEDAVKNIEWSSADESIATVDQSGLVKAKGEGETEIILTCKENGLKAGFKLRVHAPATVNEPVDLGLPSGTKWASADVGTSSSREDSPLYAWGETSVKDSYSYDNYKWADPDFINSGWSGSVGYTKYADFKFVPESEYFTAGGDGKMMLEAEDDAATAIMGSGWHMPTRAQVEELFKECYQFSYVDKDSIRWWGFINKETGAAIYFKKVKYMAGAESLDCYLRPTSERIVTGWSYSEDQYISVFGYENGRLFKDGKNSRWAGFPIRAVKD